MWTAALLGASAIGNAISSVKQKRRQRLSNQIQNEIDDDNAKLNNVNSNLSNVSGFSSSTANIAKKELSKQADKLQRSINNNLKIQRSL